MPGKPSATQLHPSSNRIFNKDKNQWLSESALRNKKNQWIHIHQARKKNLFTKSSSVITEALVNKHVLNQLNKAMVLTIHSFMPCPDA